MRQLATAIPTLPAPSCIAPSTLTFPALTLSSSSSSPLRWPLVGEKYTEVLPLLQQGWGYYIKPLPQLWQPIQLWLITSVLPISQQGLLWVRTRSAKVIDFFRPPKGFVTSKAPKGSSTSSAVSPSSASTTATTSLIALCHGSSTSHLVVAVVGSAVAISSVKRGDCVVVSCAAFGYGH